MTKFKIFLALLFATFLSQKAFSHSVQVGYCTSCDGSVRIWVEHWHGNENPNGTTMTLNVTVNGVSTNYTGTPNTSVLNTTKDNLPCASEFKVFGICPRGNTENDWVAYDFPSLPTGVPIVITVVAGHTVFTEDGCGMYPASTGVIIIPPPPNYSDIFECVDENGTVGPIATSSNTTWTNDNPGIGLSASGVGDIPAFTPPASPTGHVSNITVSNFCGTSSFILTVMPAPEADFQADGVPGNPLCLGETSVFTDNSTPIQNSTITNWNWNFGDGSPPEGSSNPTHEYTQPGQYSVELTVTDANTCTNSYLMNVSVLPLPIPDFVAAGVCEDATTVFINNSTITPVENDVISTYEWDFGNGNTSSANNPTESFGSENVYNVQLIATSNYGCKDSITIPVEVYPLPIIDFTATTECLGFETQFTDASSVSNSYTTNSNVNWNWDFADGSSENSQHPIHEYTTSGVYNSELTVTTNNGCIAALIVPITVYEPPVASFDFTNACDNEDVLLESTSTANASGNLDYFWDINSDNNTDYSINSVDHTFNQDGFHDVRLIVENSNGCRDTIVQEITVYALPSASFTFDEVCEDATTSYSNTSTVNPVDNDFVNQFDWSFGNGNSSTTENPTETFGAENIYQTQLRVTTNYGCKDSITSSVEVYPLPLVSYIASSECLGFTTVFTDESTVSNTHTPNSIIDWSWDFDDGNMGSTQNTANDYLTFGIFDTELTVTTDNGCMASVVVPVTVFELPIADFDFTNACDNEEILLASTSTANASGSLNFDWDVNGDALLDYDMNPIGHTYSHDGFHDVRLIVENSNGCLDTIVKTVTVYALPHADFDVDAVCEDATTTFANTSTINPVDGDVVSQYDWDFGNGSNSSLEDPTLAYATENLYQAKLVITTNYGCKDSITKDVSVYPLPIVDFTPTEVCLMFETHFQDLSTVNNAYTSNSNVAWDWDFADGNTANVQNPIHTYLADGVFNAVLTVTTNHDCVASKIIPVTVFALPVADFVGADLEGCSPVCPTINSTSTIKVTSTIVDYHWELTDGSVYEGSNPTFPDCFYNETGVDITYGLTLTVTSDKGCVNQHFEPDYIVVNHNPVADFYFTPDNPDVMDPVVDFHNTSLYADFYSWTFGNHSQSEEQSPIVEFPADSMSYNTQLIAYTNKGCSDTVSTVVRILDRLIFYIPNTFTPDNDHFNETFKPVFTSGFDPQSYNLYIFNRWGEMVFESHDTNVGWDGSYGVNKSDKVKDGAYIWKIEFKTSMNDERKSYQGHLNLLR